MQKKKIAFEFHPTPERRTSMGCGVNVGKIFRSVIFTIE